MHLVFIHISKIFFSTLISLLLIGLLSVDGYGQITVNGKKTIPVTAGSKLNVSKRKKSRIFDTSQKLKQRQRKAPDLSKQSIFLGSKKLRKQKRRKNKTAAFSGNIKSKTGSRYSHSSVGKFKGNIRAKRNGRRASLKKLQVALIKVPPLRSRSNPSIRKYSGNIKLNKTGGFRHTGGSYRGDIKIKKSRMASRKQARYNGGPTNALDRAKYRNQIIKNSRRKPGEYGKRPKKRNRKKQKLKYDTRESTIWNN